MAENMNNEEIKVIRDVEVLEEKEFDTRIPPPDPEEKSAKLAQKLNLHPFSGALILFLDYAFFGVGITGIALIPACIFAFFMTFIGIFLIQRFIEDENAGRSAAKAFFGAVVTAVPTPIFGTIFGSMILGVSGLSYLSNKYPKIFQKKILK